jgi:hypothetical protein
MNGEPSAHSFAVRYDAVETTPSPYHIDRTAKGDRLPVNASSNATDPQVEALRGDDRTLYRDGTGAILFISDPLRAMTTIAKDAPVPQTKAPALLDQGSAPAGKPVRPQAPSQVPSIEAVDPSHAPARIPRDCESSVSPLARSGGAPFVGRCFVSAETWQVAAAE